MRRIVSKRNSIYLRRDVAGEGASHTGKPLRDNLIDRKNPEQRWNVRHGWRSEERPHPTHLPLQNFQAFIQARSVLRETSLKQGGAALFALKSRYH